jgi:Excalibur calcium-binding domain
MRRKFTVIYLVFFLITGPILTSAKASVISGTKCSKQGLFKTVSHQTYKCVRSERGLYWEPEPKIPRPNPAQTFAQTPTPVSTIAATPSLNPAATITPTPTSNISSPQPTPQASNTDMAYKLEMSLDESANPVLPFTCTFNREWGISSFDMVFGISSEPNSDKFLYRIGIADYEPHRSLDSGGKYPFGFTFGRHTITDAERVIAEGNYVTCVVYDFEGTLPHQIFAIASHFVPRDPKTPVDHSQILVRYQSCVQARTARVTPIYQATHPELYALNKILDSNHDGIACESS